MKCECDAAVVAVLLAITVPRVENGVDIFGVQRYKAETVCNKFVGENGGVCFDFDEVNRHGGDFGKDNAAEGVGEGEVDIGEGEIYRAFCCLEDI